MQAKKTSCDLCGQPVLLSGFVLFTANGQKNFCCEGCLSIFQLLNPEQALPNQSLEKSS
jgi:hypothetical protein